MQNEQTISDIELRIKAVECVSKVKDLQPCEIIPESHALFTYLKYGMTPATKEINEKESESKT